MASNIQGGGVTKAPAESPGLIKMHALLSMLTAKRNAANGPIHLSPLQSQDIVDLSHCFSTSCQDPPVQWLQDFSQKFAQQQSSQATVTADQLNDAIHQIAGLSVPDQAPAPNDSNPTTGTDQNAQVQPVSTTPPSDDSLQTPTNPQANVTNPPVQQTNPGTSTTPTESNNTDDNSTLSPNEAVVYKPLQDLGTAVSASNDLSDDQKKILTDTLQNCFQAYLQDERGDNTWQVKLLEDYFQKNPQLSLNLVNQPDNQAAFQVAGGSIQANVAMFNQPPEALSQALLKAFLNLGQTDNPA